LRTDVRMWVVDQLPPLKFEERLERIEAQQDRDPDEAAKR
jgi:hypothetical protein